MANQSFTVPPHLSEYNVPLPTFAASRPEFTHLVVGAYIFSGNSQKQHPTMPPRALLLQRSLCDSYGGFWENPGGSCEPTDITLLDAAAREVVEETGLHVSKFVDFVCMDRWVEVKSSVVRRVAKFSFTVEVHEAVEASWADDARVQLTEHERFEWATEDQVRDGFERGLGEIWFVNDQGRNLLRAFEVWSLRGR